MIPLIVSLTLLLSQGGFTEAQIKCTMELVQIESNFHIDSRNTKTGAYGLFQLMNVKSSLPLKNQVDRYKRYISHRYKNDACLALKHLKFKNWY